MKCKSDKKTFHRPIRICANTSCNRCKSFISVRIKKKKFVDTLIIAIIESIKNYFIHLRQIVISNIICR